MALGAHWSSVRPDRVGCAGFVGDLVGSWQEDRYHNTHYYPDDDVGRGLPGGARTVPLPATVRGGLDAGRPRWTRTYGDHALVCSKGRGG